MADTIIKCDSYIVIQCDKSLLQNASGFITKSNSFIKKHDVYYTKR